MAPGRSMIPETRSYCAWADADTDPDARVLAAALAGSLIDWCKLHHLTPMGTPATSVHEDPFRPGILVALAEVTAAGIPPADRRRSTWRARIRRVLLGAS